MERNWLKNYPAGVAQHVNANEYASLVELLDNSFKKYATLPAYKFMGKDYSYQLIDEMSQAFAAYAQTLGLAQGDRVAIMMPNVPQYPVVVAGLLRAGLVVVNVNPLYTPRELAHQLEDSGAKAIVILENFAAVAATGALHAVPAKKVVLAAMGDMPGPDQGRARQPCAAQRQEDGAGLSSCPARCAGAMRSPAGRRMRPIPSPIKVGPDDIAALQYTGGTTGVSAKAQCCCIAIWSQTCCNPRPGTSRR